jgi:cold shock CspA family protein
VTNAVRHTGVILELFLHRGYGFVRGDDAVVRFMHAKDSKNFSHFRAGQLVSFETVPHTRGPRAVWVEVRAETPHA